MKAQVLYFCILSFSILVQSSFVKNRPDAIRCGDNGNAGAIFIIHSASQTGVSNYCQVYAAEDRCVTFKADGSYDSGRGHYESRRGCENRSLNQLKADKRTFQMTEENSILQKISLIQKQLAQNSKLTAEKIEKLESIQKEHEAKIKAHEEKIQRLQKEIIDLKNSQVQKLKEQLKEAKERNERSNDCFHKIQKLEQKMIDYKKEGNQAYFKLVRQMSSSVKQIFQKINQITKRFQLLELDLKLKIQEIQSQLTTNNNQIVQRSIKNLQKQFKNTTTELIKHILSLKNQIDDHITIGQGKQSQLLDKIYGKMNEDKKNDTTAKPKTNLKQDIEIAGEKSSQSKPKA